MKESSDGSFYYTTDHDEIRNWGLMHDEDNYEDVKVGTKITVEGIDYTIKSFKIEILSDTNNAYVWLSTERGKITPITLDWF